MPEAIALACGVMLLVLAWAWRRRASRRGRMLLRSRLHDPDPAVRRAAIAIAADEGIGSMASDLLEVARTDDDPCVRHELAAALARTQWEPVT